MKAGEEREFEFLISPDFHQASKSGPKAAGVLQLDRELLSSLST
jgi:hypothetical protein